MNALKHGLTAKVLALPNENPVDIQIAAEKWHDALDPQSFDEEVLVDQLAVGSIRLGRLAQYETAVVTEQVLFAEIQWGLEQKFRVIDLTRKLQTDPAKAAAELRTFSAGVEYLLGRWEDRKQVWESPDATCSLEIIKNTLRLCGYNPESLKTEPTDGSGFAMAMCCCLPDVATRAELATFIKEQISADWYMTTRIKGRNLSEQYSVDDATRIMQARADTELAALKALHAVLKPLADLSRGGAVSRALMLADTHENRLFIRYHKSAESGFDRTLKLLAKLQADREKADAAEADREDWRNEPTHRGYSYAKRIRVGDYVQVNGIKYNCGDTSDGCLCLAPVSPVCYVPAPEVPATSENVV